MCEHVLTSTVVVTSVGYFNLLTLFAIAMSTSIDQKLDELKQLASSVASLRQSQEDQ